jgi:hypothetical protein
VIPYTGSRRIDGKVVAGSYAPFNDTRWSTPDGLRIHLPEVGGLIYEDISMVLARSGVDSRWRVEVDRGE